MDKIKITQKEFDDMYELIPDLEDTKDIPKVEESKVESEFEIYTSEMDDVELEKLEL